MADRRLVGHAPPANMNEYVPGTTWIEVVEREADPSGLTVGVTVWSAKMPDHIAYNVAGPGLEQPMGPWVEDIQPAAWTVAPAADQQVGSVTHDFVIPAPNQIQFYAHVGDVDLNVSAQVGPVGESQLGKYKDPEVLAKLTPEGRRQEIRRKAGIIARNPTSTVGSPRGSSRLRRP